MSTLESSANLQHLEYLYHVFIYFKKAFDREWHATLWATMRKYNTGVNLVRAIEHLYDKATSAVFMNGTLGEWFRTITGLKPVWKDKNITLRSKSRLMRSLVMSVFLYACKTWTLTAELKRIVQAMEMRCYQKILCISHKDHVTNNRIKQAIGPYEVLLMTTKRKKLKLYGHVSRTSGMTTTILQSTLGEQEDEEDRGRGWRTT